MAFDAGLSFGPNQAGPGGKQSLTGDAGPGGPSNPVQDAIRVLSLRIPKMANSPFPQAMAPGMGGVGPQGFAMLLQHLMGGLGQQGSMGSAPAPTTTPGIVPGDNIPRPPNGYAGPGTSFDPSQRSPNTGFNGGGNPSFSGPTPGVDQGGLKPPTSFGAPSFQLWR
jgi:hypothetical protein